MAESIAGQSNDEESLKKIFDDAMLLYERIENGNDATNSDSVQVSLSNIICFIMCI